MSLGSVQSPQSSSGHPGPSIGSEPGMERALPPEMFTAIFRRTDNVEEISRVCKPWRGVCRGSKELSGKIEQQMALEHLHHKSGLATRAKVANVAGVVLAMAAFLAIVPFSQLIKGEWTVLSVIVHPLTLLLFSMLAASHGVAHMERRTRDAIEEGLPEITRAAALLKDAGGDMAAKAKSYLDTFKPFQPELD